MSYTVPTFEEIRAAYLRDLQNLLADVSTDVDSDYYVRASAIASAIDGLYAHQLWIVKQIFPDTADSDYLVLHAALHGLTRKAATRAVGTVRFTGTAGAAVPAGTEGATGDGIAYVTTEAAVLDDEGTVDVPSRASSAGADGNLDAETELTLTSAPSGVDAMALVIDMLGGTDAETDASLLERLLEALRNPPSGGNAADYKRWALEVDGVTQAWVYPLRRGIGTVDVAVASSGGLPSASLLADVQSHVDEVRPATVKELWAVSPTEVPVDVTAAVRISGATLDQVQARVESALAEYFADMEPGDTVYRSRLEAIITDIPGVVDRELTAPAASVDTTTALPGGIEWPRLGTVTLTLMED